MIPRDMVRGTRLEPLRVGDVLVADAICFDVAYDDGIDGQVARGAELVTVQTSNAMFIHTGQIDQQFEISRLRALETGRWVVVAADQRRLRRHRAPTARSSASVRGPRPGGPRRDRRRSSTTLTPAVRLGVWPGRGWSWRSWSCTRRSSLVTYRRRRRGDRAVAPEPPEPDEAAPRERRRPRPRRDGRPDLQRGARTSSGSSAGCAPPQPGVDVLVVDDNSPRRHRRDRRRAGRRRPARSRVVHRTEKAGLGAAYLHGFAVALDAGYDVIGEMDADGSHQPEQLHRLLDALRDADLVIGSRWVPGRLGRQLAACAARRSRAAATSTSGCCSASTSSDATAGFRLFRRATLEKIDLGPVRSTGYVFQTDLAYRTLRGRADGRRGADRVRRAGARRLQDERRRWPPSRCKRITRWGLRERRAQVRRRRRRGRSGRRRRPPTAGAAGCGSVLVVAFVVVPLVEIWRSSRSAR